MRPGTVVVTKFPGVESAKRRPAIVISSEVYQRQRPDVILAAVTTQVHKATAQSDFILHDWESAGLVQRSAVRMFLYTMPRSEVREIGELSEGDWSEVRQRLRLSIDF